MVDVLGVVILRVLIGFGVSQFVDGVYAITGIGMDYRQHTEVPKPALWVLLAAFVIMEYVDSLEIVRRRAWHKIPCQSGLSVILLLTFVFYGSFFVRHDRSSDRAV
jgi:hypothetical protein